MNDFVDDAMKSCEHIELSEDSEETSDVARRKEYFVTPTLAMLKELYPQKFEEDQFNMPGDADLRDRVAKLKLIDVPTKQSDAFVNFMLRKSIIGNAGGPESVVVLYGESHSGKSHILNQVTWIKRLMPYESSKALIRPLVSVEAPAPSTLKALGIEILDALDPRLEARTKTVAAETHVIWRRVRALLRLHRVKFLVIDEIHNVFLGKALKEIGEIANTIKKLLVSKDWPVCVVLCGTEEAISFVDKSPELFNRSKRFSICPIPPTDHVELRDFLKEIESQLDFTQLLGLDLGDLPDRFRWASRGLRGRIARLIADAAEIAYVHDSPCLSLADLAQAYSEATTAGPNQNPFLKKSVSESAPPSDDVWDKTKKCVPDAAKKAPRVRGHKPKANK